MTVPEILKQLEEWGNENTVRIFKNHGAKDPIFGVKVGDLKKLVKKIKKDHELALELWETGNSDAMYLAGLIADETKMSREQLQRWAETASWYMLSDYSVASVAAESPYAMECANGWIKSDKQLIASAGWSTYSGFIAITDNAKLDIKEIKSLVDSIEQNILDAKNRVRYAMNSFVISVGGYIPELSEYAKGASERIGKVSVYMGKTSCKVPFGPEYIEKMIVRGSLEKKRKVARC
jgi:3-methyladenine DNA glycosylase AlkD